VLTALTYTPIIRATSFFRKSGVKNNQKNVLQERGECGARRLRWSPAVNNQNMLPSNRRNRAKVEPALRLHPLCRCYTVFNSPTLFLYHMFSVSQITYFPWINDKLCTELLSIPESRSTAKRQIRALTEGCDWLLFCFPANVKKRSGLRSYIASTHQALRLSLL
jgi:hypothetical protein